MTSIAEERFQAAIDEYWAKREAQTAKQVLSGKVDAGTRGAVSGTSYRDRYQVLCRRLVSDGLYDAACFVTSSRLPGARIVHPDPALSFAALQRAIAERAALIRTMR